VTDSEHANRITAWVEGYQRAWNSNDPAEIGALFTDDARYCQRPYWEPWSGREQIIAEWLAHKDEPDDYTFSWHPILAGPTSGVVRADDLPSAAADLRQHVGDPGSTNPVGAASSPSGGWSTRSRRTSGRPCRPAGRLMD
jgi:hypothetical protein